MPSSRPALSASLCAHCAASSIDILAMGMSGHTSVAPMRGCSPWCLLMSISSLAFFIARKAASTTGPGSPTKVTTVRLVALPGSTSSNCTPATLSIAAVICLMIAMSRPSLKLGTHSMSCSPFINLNCFCPQMKGFFVVFPNPDRLAGASWGISKLKLFALTGRQSSGKRKCPCPPFWAVPAVRKRKSGHFGAKDKT